MVHMWVVRRSLFAPVALCAFASLLLGGCSEVRGRRKIQEANSLYKESDYKGAVAAFEEAEKLVPDLPVLWLNKGFTCRQLIVPGTKTPESVSASKCALSAFLRYKELKPDDSRGDMLYVQTLFDPSWLTARNIDVAPWAAALRATLQDGHWHTPDGSTT